ncbi:MAG: hypothetical protein FWD83_06390 [Promicromonosporaceae bacterium]|nr:hypothetical protein [Promicromonosporaceae bacterium]
MRTRLVVSLGAACVLALGGCSVVLEGAAEPAATESAVATKLPTTGTLHHGDDTSDITYVLKTEGLQPMPEHGAMRWFVTGERLVDCQQSRDRGNYGDLTLSTPVGGDFTFVKLSDEEGPVFGVMLEPGRSITLKAPLCGTGLRTYTLTQATGPAWYGWDELFGPYGRYAALSGSFQFDRYTNWDVVLNLRPGGNLTMTDIDPADF